jgi:hypothetical protein
MNRGSFCETVMLEADRKPAHYWLEVAADARKETDPRKLRELIGRLCEALETIRLERSLWKDALKEANAEYSKLQ